MRFVAAMLCVATTLFLWQTSRRTGGNSESEPSRGVASAKVGASQDSRTKAGMPQSFAFAEALTVLTLKRMAIASDVSLVAERKSERLLELDSGAGHTDRTEADNATVVADQERRYDLAQMSASRRAAERETLWGKQASERLAKLDGQRARWNARIERYLYARSRIDADRNLSSCARAQAVAALRARHFDAAEQRRVASLEAIGQLKPGD